MEEENILDVESISVTASFQKYHVILLKKLIFSALWK